MAVVNRLSTALTNRDTVPRINNPPYLSGGTRQQQRATFELANGDSIGSTYRFASVPSGAIINSIRVFCDAITSGAMDVGVYRNTDAGSAVVLATAYATAQSIASAIVTGTEVAFEARDIANVEKRVWEDAGLTTDPGGTLDLVGTLTAATTAAGTLSFIVDYTVP